MGLVGVPIIAGSKTWFRALLLKVFLGVAWKMKPALHLECSCNQCPLDLPQDNLTSFISQETLFIDSFFLFIELLVFINFVLFLMTSLFFRTRSYSFGKRKRLILNSWYLRANEHKKRILKFFILSFNFRPPTFDAKTLGKRLKKWKGTKEQMQRKQET